MAKRSRLLPELAAKSRARAIAVLTHAHANVGEVLVHAPLYDSVAAKIDLNRNYANKLHDPYDSLSRLYLLPASGVK